MAIVKKISELTPKGSALSNTDLLVVGVDNGTDYDLKSVTGAQILGNVISQTITDGDTTHSPSSNVVFDSLALKVDKVTGKGLSTEDYTTAEKSKLAGLSGTNTGDQTLQQVTDKGSTTTNPISITTTGANSYLAGNTIISQNNFGRYATIDSDGKVTINSNGVNTSQLRASNITADVILEFPNKTVGSYTIATTTDLTSKVPYTGATTNVDLGEYELKAGQLSLDITPIGTAAVGTTRWNDTLGSSETTLKGGSVIIKNGIDLVARIVNKVTPNTTLTKANYQVVKVSGAQGQRLAVNLAQANNDNNSADTLGIVCETIATNQEGFILTVGQLENVNTTGSLQSETWVDGDVLYLSPTTAGKITNIKPTEATGHIVILGYVEYAHAINGKIYVKIMNGWELDELHNVSISAPLDKQLLSYENSTSLWKNKSVTTADIADSLNKRYVTDANLTTIGNTSGTNTGDQIISDATITTTDITTNNFTTAKHGFVPKGTNTGKFLKDDGTWGTPASGGSGVCGIANSSGVYTYYATLSLAITAAVSGQTVDLLTDITETGSVTLSMKAGVKINGNGYTYTLSVNDDTSLLANGTSLAMEFFNIKFVRTGRANNLGGRVFLKSDDTTLVTIRCQNVLFENTYGVAVFANFTEIYGANIKSYGSCVISDTGIYNCNLISSTGLGIENTSSAREVVNCNVTSSGTAIKMTYGNVYNSVGRCSSGVGIYAFRVVNSMGISVSDTGIATTTTLAGHTGYNCVGISTSGVGLNGTFTNSTGVSTSGYGGTNGTKTNCTLISSSNYASFQENLNNSFLQSTTNVPLWLSTGKLVNTCTAICLWDNTGGHAINTTSASTGVDIRNSSLTVTNASAYCINGALASTFKYANNSFKGSTTAVNTTNITQGITNTSDTKGNILI